MDALIRELNRKALDTGFSGVVSIFRGVQVLFNQAYGYRDVKNGLPNTPETRFAIASGTKTFTALGIGVLIDQGVISLDTQVGEIDRQYKGFIDPSATILHLLTHTSGIYDYYDEEIEQDYEHFSVEIPWCQLETPSDYYPLFRGKVMKFRPGVRFAYSNGGFVFLGMLIERLSGKLYRDFVEQHVLRKAQMQRSGFYAFNDLPENTANGYLQDRHTTNIYQLPLRGGADGGMYTTSQDLRVFWERLIAGKILSEELTAAYLKARHAFDEVEGYSCGMYRCLDGSLYWTDGADAGVGFESRHFPQTGMTLNLLSNITDGTSELRGVILEHI